MALALCHTRPVEIPCSIVVPVLDGERFLSDFLAQFSELDLGLHEIIFVNDHSTDRTHQILTNWCKDIDNSSLIENPGFGLAAALNEGIRRAKHEWIARMDIDDFYNPVRLRLQTSYCSPNVAVIFSDYTIQDSCVGISYEVPVAIFHEPTIISLFSNYRNPHPVALMQRAKVIEVGGYSSQAFPAEDLDLWFRISRVGNLVGYPENLFCYNRNSSSVTFKKRNEVLAKHSAILKRVDSQSTLRNALIKSDDEFQSYISAYKHFGNSDQRICHFILDLFLVKTYFNPKHKLLFFCELLGRLFRNKQSIFIVVRLARIRFKRKINLGFSN